MAGRRRIDVAEKDLSGFKYFEKLKPLFERLHEAGCVRDKAGNRELHFDEYCTLILLFLFNPIVTSLREEEKGSGPIDRRAAPGSLRGASTRSTIRVCD